MDDETNHTNDPIDEFLELSKTNDLGSLRIVIQRALSHPSVFAGFSELLVTPSIHALSTSNDADQLALYHTLELFAYGTMKDYCSAPPGTYIKLSPTQETKLRQLSFVSLAQTLDPTTGTRPARLHYSAIYPAIYPDSTTSLPNTSISNSIQNSSPSLPHPYRVLEDLIISCIYSNIITGKLDQRSQSFCLSKSSKSFSSSNGNGNHFSRDVALSSLPHLITQLEQWRNQSNQVLAVQLEHAIQSNQSFRTTEKQHWKNVHDKMEEVRLKLHGGGGNTTSSSVSARAAAVAAAGNASGDDSAAFATGLPGLVSSVKSSASSAKSSRMRNRKRYYE